MVCLVPNMATVGARVRQGVSLFLLVNCWCYMGIKKTHHKQDYQLQQHPRTATHLAK